MERLLKGSRTVFAGEVKSIVRDTGQRPYCIVDTPYGETRLVFNRWDIARLIFEGLEDTDVG